MAVQRARFADVLRFPHTLEQRLAEQRRIWILHKQNQEIELLACEVDTLAVLIDVARVQVDQKIQALDHALALVEAAQHDLDAGELTMNTAR